MADTRAIDNSITIDQLNATEQVKTTDLLYSRSDTGADAKMTMAQLKSFVVPNDASATQSGLVNTSTQSFAGDKTFTDKLTVTGDATLNSGATVNGTLNITGDLIVNGEEKKIEVQTLEVKDELITVRDGAETPLASTEVAGLKVKNYNGTTDALLVVDSNGTARVGDTGDTQPLATRLENPTNNSLAVWNATNKRYENIPCGNEGDLLESRGSGQTPHFTSLPKVSIESVTQTKTAYESNGVNEITCKLTNGVQTKFEVRNGSAGTSKFARVGTTEDFDFHTYKFASITTDETDVNASYSFDVCSSSSEDGSGYSILNGKFNISILIKNGEVDISDTGIFWQYRGELNFNRFFFKFNTTDGTTTFDFYVTTNYKEVSQIALIQSMTDAPNITMYENVSATPTGTVYKSKDVQNRIVQRGYSNFATCTTETGTAEQYVYVRGVDYLAENMGLTVLFKNVCSSENPTLKVNEQPAYPIKVIQDGQIKNIATHQGYWDLDTTGTLENRTWGANTVLELRYCWDINLGYFWLIVGNPIVASNHSENNGYSVYSNGLIKQTYFYTRSTNLSANGNWNIENIPFIVVPNSIKSISHQIVGSNKSGGDDLVIYNITTTTYSFYEINRNGTTAIQNPKLYINFDCY